MKVCITTKTISNTVAGNFTAEFIHDVNTPFESFNGKKLCQNWTILLEDVFLKNLDIFYFE